MTARFVGEHKTSNILSTVPATHDQTKQAILRQLEARQALAASLREREICAATSRGSISLQKGEYFTPDDTEAIKKELVDYFLPNHRQ